MSRDWSKEAAACDDFVLSAYEDFSVDTVADLLLPSGLLIDKSTQYAGTFEKYVFLNGNKEEVYSRQEIDFISAIDKVFIFTEFHKETKRSVIPCRVFAVRNTSMGSLDFAIAFTNILSKANDSFNICLIVSDDGLIFTCRGYDAATISYYISDIIHTQDQMDALFDELIFATNYDGFVEYYSEIREAIRFKTETADYLSKLKRDHRPSYSYIEELQEIEFSTGINFSREIERCFWGMEETYKESYADQVAEAEEYLFRIESSRINTMEMLFEAEEMEKLASEAEQRNEALLNQNTAHDERQGEDMDEETKALLEDPETMIKLLKKKRGI